MADRNPERNYLEGETSQVEILPPEIGELSTEEASPLLERAASRIDILKPKDEFWEGLRENLEGASQYIKAKKGEIASKSFRAVAGGTLVATMVAACGGEVQSPQTPETEGYPEPTATEVIAEPTVNTEVIENVNESAQSMVDREFEGVGIEGVSLIGAGFLEDSDGNQYGLFSSEIKSASGETAEFMLLGQVEGSGVETIKGLVLDENDEGPVFEYFGVSYNKEEKQFVIGGELLRMSTQTGKMEIQVDGEWQELRGPDQTFDSVQASLGQGVLAAPRLNDLTPTPEPTPTPTEIPLPESFADQEAQQEVVDEFLEVSGYASLEEAGEVLKRMSWYGEDQFRITSSDEGAASRIVWGFVVGSYEISLEGKEFSGLRTSEGDRALIMLIYNPELEDVVPILLGGEIDERWFFGTQFVWPYDERNPGSSDEKISEANRKFFNSVEGSKSWVTENRGSLIETRWLYSYSSFDDLGKDNRLDRVVNNIAADSSGYIARYTEDNSMLFEALEKEPVTGSTRYILENLDTDKDVGIIAYRIVQLVGYSVIR